MSNNPFPGLRPFKQNESTLFFGRDGQSDQLLKRLQDSRFLALVGVSGSGKSSLIRAGLLPKLEGALMSAVQSDWRVAVFRPGNNPISNMARALVTDAKLGGDSGYEDIETAIAETTLRRGNLGLLELIKEAKRKVRENGEPFLGPKENVLIVVDQFEEIFRIIEQYEDLIRVKQLSGENSTDNPTAVTDDLKGHPREEASAFVKLLLESTKKIEEKDYDENVYIIVTMRSDYLGDTAQFLGMPEKINEGQYLIPRMDRVERRKAIEGPIAVRKGSISEPLVNQLLNDAGEDPGKLPILQHALMRMWDLAEKAPRNGGLNLNHYKQIETLDGALSQHANEAFKELSEEHQKLASKIFKCLTEKSLANRETRRPMNIADICEVVGAQENDVKTVVDCFRKNGRWFLMPSVEEKEHLERDTLIDISHESLISGWDKLREWVNEEAESARVYKRLADTAILKEVGEEEFYRGATLEVALEWRDDNAPNEAWARRYHPEYDKAICFLKDSQSDAEREAIAKREHAAKELRKTRTYNTILGVLAAMCLLLGIFFVGLQRRMSAAEVGRAKERAEESSKQRGIAIENEKEALRLKQIAEDARTTAQNAATELEKSLKKETIALGAARKAEGVAIAERKKAEKLQKENEEQATTNAYFKDAFGHVAARDFNKAAKSLGSALDYYVKKEKEAGTKEEKEAYRNEQFSTIINIGDVYRASGAVSRAGGKEPTTDAVALEKYEAALALIGKADTEKRAQALTKAGSVWEDSKNATRARSAAHYHEEAAKVYSALQQNANRSVSLMNAGNIRARFFDNEDDAQKAFQDFRGAVQALGDDKKLTAHANEKIGEKYLDVVTQDAEKTKDTDSTTDDPATKDATTREGELSPEVLAENRAREAGATFFSNAASDYAALKEDDKVAEMKKQVGTILSRNNRQLENAKRAFDSAAKLYAGMKKIEEQKELLLEAGAIFVASKDPSGRRLADYFYQQVVNLAANNDEKIEVLTDIAESYEAATDLTLRQRAVSYYEQVSALHRQLNQKREEAEALISAAAVVRDFNDGESKTKTKELYDRAVALYQDDPKEQAKTLEDIGDSYAASEQAAKKQESIDYYRRAATVASTVDKAQQVKSLLRAGRTLIGLETAQAREEAQRFFEQAIIVYEGDVAKETSTISEIGTFYISAEPPQKQNALEYFDRAIHVAHEKKNKAAEVNAIIAKAGGFYSSTEAEGQHQIEQLYERAIAVYNDDPGNQAETLVRVGRLVFGTGRDAARLEKAEGYFTQAVNQAKPLTDKKVAASVHSSIAGSYGRFQPLWPKAAQHYREALAYYETAGDQLGQATTLYRLINIDRRDAVNMADRALPLYASALPALKASGDQKQLGDAYYAMGSMFFRQKKDYPAALDSFRKALDIRKTLGTSQILILSTETQIRAVQRAMNQSAK